MDINKICRCCMEASTNMKSLFDKCDMQTEILEISQMLDFCIQLQFLSEEVYPTNICLRCLEELTTTYKFKRKCVSTDIKFKEYFINLRKNIEPLKQDIKTKKKKKKKIAYDNSSNLEVEKIDIYEETKTKVDKIVDNEKKNNFIKERVKDIESNTKKITDKDVDFALNEKNVCQICKKIFLHTSSLVIHMKRHNGVKNYKCHLCTKAFTTSSSLKVHMLSHTGERAFECTECKKCFATKDALHKHRRKHTGERCHLCSFCGKGFGTSGTLQTHMRTHSGDKPLKCNICDMSFAAHAGLVVHMRKHTGERPYLCSQCGKGFKSSSDLTSHMRKHTGERPYSCDLCNKSFRTSYMRSVHRRIHTGEKPAQCDICKKSFISNGHLTSHLRTHLDIKPHSCTVCERNFSTSRDLTLHAMVHTGVKPHICPTCGKGFNRSNNFQKHMRVHTGIKPYVCEICKYAFGTSTQLTIHFRSHTGERPYCCKSCDKTFSSSSGLARHKKRAHCSTKPTDNAHLDTNPEQKDQKIDINDELNIEVMTEKHLKLENENKINDKNLLENQVDILTQEMMPNNQFCDSKETITLHISENELQDTINMVESFEIVNSKHENVDEKLHYEMLQNVQTDGLKIDNNLINDAQMLGMPSIASMFIPLNRQSVDDIFKCKYS